MEVNLDEATDKAAEELLGRLEKGTLKWSQNAAIVGVHKAGNFTFSTNQACHAGLSSLGPSERVVSAIMQGHGYAEGRKLKADVELWFVDYILNRSPYAETFITKDAEKALEQKYTVSDGNHPANLVAAGMVALRRLWEYTWVAQAAYDLSKLGVNEDLAFLLGHNISTSIDPNAQTASSWGNCTSGHCSVNPSIMGWGQVKNFLQHAVKVPRQLFSHSAGYYGYDGMYGEQNGESYYKFVKANFPYAKCKGESTSNLNPFTAALAPANVGQSVPYNKAIAVMAEWANTTLMEKINNA